MLRVKFVGYGDLSYSHFLNSLAFELEKYEVTFSAVYFGRSEGFDKLKFNFPFLDLGNIPEGEFEPCQFFSLFKADFYIIWNGYHRIYSKLREYLEYSKIPYLISEFTGIDKLFHFDKGLHGESTFLTKTFQESPKRFLGKNKAILGSYIKGRIASTGIHKAFDFKKRKVVLFIGVWDEAAGLSDVKKSNSPFFNNSLDALSQLLECCVVDGNVLIVKPHPGDQLSNKANYKNICSCYPNVYYADESHDINHLIKYSDVIVTICSTLSILAAFNYKPLLLLGKTYISGYGYAYQIEGRQDVGRQLECALKKLDWRKRLVSLNQFFYNYLVQNEVFSNDGNLKTMGVKSPELLAGNIYENIINANINDGCRCDDLIFKIFEYASNEISISKKRIRFLEAQINSMANTFSWQITTPLRTIGKLVSWWRRK